MTYTLLGHRIRRNGDGVVFNHDERDPNYPAYLAWLQAGGTPEIDAFGTARAARLQALAARRWEATQRFTYDGVVTQADPAIAVITAAVVGRQAFNITAPQTWKLADGEFRQFDTPELLAFGGAVQAHIQACFDNEAALTAAIVAAETPEALAEINLEQGWPP